MKKIILLMGMGLLAILSNAQEMADILVSYEYHYPSLFTGKVEGKNQYVLAANPRFSKFYSPRTEYIDSLSSTPQGKAALDQITAAAVMNEDYDKIPTRDGSFYVTKSSDTVRYYDSLLSGSFVVEEPRGDMSWEIGDSTKTILGYECVGALCDYHGRKWTAWFAVDIPVQDGPWKLSGLPGLILEAETDGGQYCFVATGVQQSNAQITPVPRLDKYEKSTRQDFWKSKRSFIENPLGQIDAQFGKGDTKIMTTDGDMPKFVARETVDFIETDY